VIDVHDNESASDVELALPHPTHRLCVSADAARFNCENSKVTVGERNVCLKCEVRARPRLTQLFWVIDENGTTVHEGQVVDQYWTLILVRLYTFNTLQTGCELTPSLQPLPICELWLSDSLLALVCLLAFP